MTLFSIPDSWAWASFGDVARIASNLVDPKDYQNKPHIAPNHIEPWTGRILDYATIQNDGVTSPKHYFHSGQILYSKIRPYLAKISLVDFEGLCSADMYPIDTNLNARYLKWWMLTPMFVEESTKHQGRVVLPKINAEALRKLCVPVPPLEEQCRIVAALESHLSRLDKISHAVERARIRASALRRKVLDDEDSRLSDVPWKQLGELLREPLRNGHSARATQDATGIRTLTLTAVTNNQFIEKNTKLAAADPDRVRHLWLRSGDIFIQRSNTPELVGSSALYRGPEDWAIFPDLLIRIRVAPSLLPEFVHLMLSTTRTKRYLRSSAKGLAGSMPKIDQGTIERIELPTPPLDVQREFVEFVKAQQEGVSRLIGGLEGARSRSSQLRRSLLREAFAGRLLPQDPTDEPALALLARIRAERANQLKPQRARRTKPKESPSVSLAEPSAASRTEWPDSTRTPTTYEQGELL
ncbi:restriction endonuclease subunit S [Streptosporangium minutum]|uniref:restriction endonuclease subunit S n=1 Tax=Streptosporangium minutum TaxID=569862 RepID=UPI0013FE1813|nr:restriction endonuclease subunit S [Streptosporangium minutum]